MKTIVYVLIALLAIGMVSATTVLDVKVRCDEGRWNSVICTQYDLQDDFDNVVDFVNAVHYEMEHNNALFDTRLTTEENKKDNTGSRGLRMYEVTDYLSQSFIPELNMMYVNKEEYRAFKQAVANMELQVRYTVLGYTKIYTNGVLWFGESPIGEFERLYHRG